MPAATVELRELALHIRSVGTPAWRRDLAAVLNYTQWRNFEQAIERAAQRLSMAANDQRSHNRQHK